MTYHPQQEPQAGAAPATANIQKRSQNVPSKVCSLLRALLTHQFGGWNRSTKSLSVWQLQIKKIGISSFHIGVDINFEVKVEILFLVK